MKDCTAVHISTTYFSFKFDEKNGLSVTFYVIALHKQDIKLQHLKRLAQN